MPPEAANQLNNRKPFKLLAQLEAGELDLLRMDLLHRSRFGPTRYYKKLIAYLDRAIALDAFRKPVSRAAFVQGTDLPTSSNAFDKLTSSFYNYLQEYLAGQELFRDPVAVQQLAFRGYCQLPFGWKEIKRRHGEAHRELDKLPQSSRISNERLVLDLDLATQANDRSVPPDERGYTDLLEALEANYVIQKLRVLCAIANDRRIFRAPAPDWSITTTLPPLRPFWPPLARMYYLVYQLLTGEESAHSMQELQRTLDEQDVQAPTYPREDMLDLYGYLLNALTRKVNQGNPNALRSLSRLHDHLIEKGILMQDGMISAEHFKNVIMVKLKTREIGAARRHFDELSDKISNDPDRNGIRYNHTLLLYEEGQLEQAAKELEELCGQPGNLKLDHFYGLDLRATLLKIYYDLLEKAEANHVLWDETDEKLVRLLESYRGYIERKRLPADRFRTYDGIRRIIQGFYNFAYRFDPEAGPADLPGLEAAMIEAGRGEDSWFRDRLERLKRYRD